MLDVKILIRSISSGGYVVRY